MMRIIILFCLLATVRVLGQENYQLDTVGRGQLEKYVLSYRHSNEQLIQKIITEYPKKTAKKLIGDLREFGVEFEKSILEGDYIFDERFLDTANRILDELKEKNTGIPEDINVFISKDPSLNAFCLPDGTFVINMGLFYWLDNQDQIAGVMSHELSHYLLRHSIKRQVQRIKNERSKHKKKEIRRIKRTRYNKSERAYDLFKKLLYTERRNSRKNEIEADSLGFLLLEKTRYNPSEMINSLKLAKMYDTIRPKDLDKDIYKKIFDLPNQKFNPDWLKMEDYSGYHYDLFKERFNLDSIATHPDVMTRVQKLQTLLDAHHLTTSNSEPDSNFLELNKIAENNIVPHLMHFDQIGVGIYWCLKQIQEGNDEKYYKKLLGKNFKIILEGRKKYQLNRYLERPNPKEHSESYLQFLNFMWNLSLSEIENITKYYTRE